MKTDLDEKVVIVTGASGGIGRAAARSFAAEGARLVLHYHKNFAEADELKKLLRTETLLLQADLRNEEQVVNLFASARKSFGRIDTLVANAGVWPSEHVLLCDMSLERWKETFETDLTSVFLCCREFSKVVRDQRRGNIVLVGSTAGVFGEAGHADYASAKSAIATGLTRTLKNELSRIAPHTADYCGGRVNCVCPGWVMTRMASGALANTDAVKKVTATMALPQLARPDDIANAIVFLSSDTLARHITGQTWVVAGGMEGRLLWQPAEIDPTIV
jgi:3-oxoacyl-[acyl-carrier protein] reductase